MTTRGASARKAARLRVSPCRHSRSLFAVSMFGAPTNSYVSEVDAMTMSGLTWWILARRALCQRAQSSIGMPSLPMGVTSATGHDDLVIVISRHPRCRATSLRAGNQCAAWESPVSTTVLRPAEGPYVNVQAFTVKPGGLAWQPRL